MENIILGSRFWTWWLNLSFPKCLLCAVIVYTVNAVISGDKFFAFGSMKTYSRVVKFALSRLSSLVILYCTKLTSYNDALTSNWAAQKQSRPHTFSNILPICINTHGHYTTPKCPKCAYRISQTFSRVFEFALAEFCLKFAKINAPRILPRLQYLPKDQ